MVAIAPRYFEAVGVRVVEGRDFSWDDGRPGNETAIVNERFARMHFPDGVTVGRRIQLASDTPAAKEPWLTIVGISPTIRQSPSSDPAPVVYLPIRSTAPPTTAILVRGQPGSNATAAVLRDQVRALDPDLPLVRVLSMEQVLSDAGWNGRMASTLIRSIATIGLLLAIVGLYAVTSSAVEHRRREIGVRIAVGARSLNIGWLVVRRAMLHVGLGALVGVGCTLAWDRLLGDGGAEMSDPVVLLAVTTLIAAVGATAS